MKRFRNVVISFSYRKVFRFRTEIQLLITLAVGALAVDVGSDMGKKCLRDGDISKDSTFPVVTHPMEKLDMKWRFERMGFVVGCWGYDGLEHSGFEFGIVWEDGEEVGTKT